MRRQWYSFSSTAEPGRWLRSSQLYDERAVGVCRLMVGCAGGVAWQGSRRNNADKSKGQTSNTVLIAQSASPSIYLSTYLPVCLFVAALRELHSPSSIRISPMSIKTALTDALGLRVPVVQGGMQWVGRPQLAAAVSSAGGLGMITALTQPSPDHLRQAIREAHSLLKPGVRERSKFGAIGVNITLLPSINPPDYEGYARAALEEGIRIFETAGNAPTK